MTAARTVLLCGLSGTGKSSFLAALWGSIRNKNTPCALALAQLGDERDYLESLWRKWVRAEPIEKSASEIVQPVELHLLDKRRQPPPTLLLQVPDMSGETFREQFESRQWTRDFEDQFAGAESVLLFAHSVRMEEGLTLAEVQHARLGLGNAGGKPAIEPNDKPDPWEIRRCRTQVQLVISAWDLLDGTPLKTPNQWLRKKMGLMEQYLAANPSQFTAETFGVSAQGFDYKEGEDPDTYLARFANSAERVRVLCSDDPTVRHDITQPLQWLLPGD